MAETLTREQVLDMPAGEEMDRLIAEKVFGDQFDGDTITDGKRCWPIPDYSTNVAAAWQVIDRIYRRFCGHISIERFAWLSYEVKVGGLPADGGGWREVAAMAGAAPLAICRAALLTTLKADR
jgi:hypothetical protein